MCYRQHGNAHPAEEHQAGWVSISHSEAGAFNMCHTLYGNKAPLTAIAVDANTHVYTAAKGMLMVPACHVMFALALIVMPWLQTRLYGRMTCMRHGRQGT